MTGDFMQEKRSITFAMLSAFTVALCIQFVVHLFLDHDSSLSQKFIQIYLHESRGHEMAGWFDSIIPLVTAGIVFARFARRAESVSTPFAQRHLFAAFWFLGIAIEVARVLLRCAYAHKPNEFDLGRVMPAVLWIFASVIILYGCWFFMTSEGRRDADRAP